MLREELERERRRIRSGPARDEQSSLPIFDQLKVACLGNADFVLDRTREVLDKVLGHIQDDGITVERWRGILPSWFVAASAQERPQNDVDLWEAELKRIPREQWPQWVLQHPRLTLPALNEVEAWSIGAFVYWFEPDRRQWWWWDAHAQNADTLIIQLMVDEDYMYGALAWLFKVAGATDVESVQEYGHE